MSTRCQTRIDMGGERVLTFYRHCDGYPNGHGLDLCRAIEKAGNDIIELLSLLKFFDIEIEPANVAEHGDVEFIYEVNYPSPYERHDKNDEIKVRITKTRSWETRYVMYEGTPKEVRMEMYKSLG